LLLRINLALGTAFVLAALLLVYVCSRLLATNAQRELMREAGLMMDSAVATFAYTSEEILPLLQEPMQSTFLPQSAPFYATTQNFLRLHAQHPEYSFKEATLNPTNPRDRAMDWEADLIQHWQDAFPPPLARHCGQLCRQVNALLGTAPVAPRSAFSSEELGALQRRLAHHVGPLASYLLKRAAASACSWTELTAQLAAEIDAAPARQAFLEGCRAARP
jgi:hypothetical protein